MGRKVVKPKSEPTEFVSEKGPQRNYVSFQPFPEDIIITKSEKIQLGIFVILSYILRLWNIGYPSNVVFDEVVVGNAINSYLNSHFKVDLNPPAIKIIYSWFVSFFYYVTPSFIFDQGKSYLNSNLQSLFPYMALRSVSAGFSSMLVLFAYKTARASGVRHTVALFGAFLILVENSIITQSRFFFLDGPFLFFVAFAISSLKSSEQFKIFSKKWLSYVFLMAVALGYSISTKIAGIFTLIWVVAIIVKECWSMLGDLRKDAKIVLRSSIFKFSSIIVIPISIYIFFYFVHINILNHVGPDYGFLSPDYQHTLQGNHLTNLTRDVVVGSNIRIRNYYTGKYLHSYNAMYRNGHTQVTLVSNYRDQDNIWNIRSPTKFNSTMLRVNMGVPINESSQIRLFHKHTNRFLRIDRDAKPPLSEQDYNQEVTALGNSSWLGDDYTDMRVQIVPEYCRNEESKHKLQAVNSVFQLHCAVKMCSILGTSKKLPDWGHGQNEVLCIKSPTLVKSLWYIDYNDSPSKDTTAKVEFPKFGFWAKFIELNKILIKGFLNNTAEHTYMSSPIDWIFSKKGIPYSIGAQKVVFLLGNIVTYYLVIFCAVSFALWEVARLILWNPTQSPVFNARNYKYEYHGLDFFLGYILNLLPYMILERTSFLFDYLPALYFGILLVCETFELIISKRPKLGYIFMIAWALFALAVFVEYSPIIYGLAWTRKQCEAVWLSPSTESICQAFA